MSTAVLAASVVACSPTSSGSRGSTTAATFDLSAYCELASRAGIVDITARSAITCETVSDDEVGDGPSSASCTVLVADSDGNVTSTSIEGALVALRVSGSRYVVLTTDQRLVLHNGVSEVREIAQWAADPSVDADGSRVAFVSTTDGSVPDLGDPTVLVAYDLASQTTSEIVDDEFASSPVFVPGSEAVLYVSTTSGVASIWRVEGSTKTQLTNLGAADVGQGFVPSFARQNAWTSDHAFLVYGTLSNDGDAELWALDAARGDAYRVGSGAFPLTRDDGTVVAVDLEAGTCPVELDLEVTP